MAMVAGVAGGCALTSALLFSALARPQDGDARVAVVTQRIDQAERLFRQARNGPSFAPDAVCDSAEDQTLALKEAISSLALQGNVEVHSLDVTPAAAESEAGLPPLRFRFEVTGAYVAVISVLGALDRQGPQVFVDAVDMTSKSSNVSLAFSGRVFCSG